MAQACRLWFVVFLVIKSDCKLNVVYFFSQKGLMTGILFRALLLNLGNVFSSELFLANKIIINVKSLLSINRSEDPEYH